MSSLFNNTGNNYINKILAHKDLLISELTDEFGKEYEDLLRERFDKIEFIFFVSIYDFSTYVRRKYSELAASKVVDHIKNYKGLENAYVDDKFKHIAGYAVSVKNNDDLLFSYFRNYILTFVLEDNDENYFGVYSFGEFKNLERLHSLAVSRNMTDEEFITNNRCEFLREIGVYPIDYSNEMICNDENYSSLCEKYKEFIEKYKSIVNGCREELKNEIDILNKMKGIREKIYFSVCNKMLKELSMFLSDDDRKKVDSGDYSISDIAFLNVFFDDPEKIGDKSKLESESDDKIKELLSTYYGENANRDIDISKVKLARESASKFFNKQMAEALVFETNCDISNVNFNMDLSTVYGEMFSDFEQENGIEKHRYIFFNPYASDENTIDIHLRHELRHSLTSSVQKIDGFDIVKVGNAEFVCKKDEIIESNNDFYNELITQKRAVDNTRKSFKKGIYILSPYGAKFPNGYTSAYDVYFNQFNEILDLIPKEVLNSQIELSNKNLYSVFSKEAIKDIERAILDGNIPVNLLKTSDENQHHN